MAKRGTLFGLSVAVHGGLAVAIGAIHVREARMATAIALADVPKPRAAEPAPPPPPEPPAPKRARNPRPAPAPATAPPPDAQASAPLSALPDFGVSLAGGVESGGIALPGAAPLAALPVAPERGTAAASRHVAKLRPAPQACAEGAVKPKPKRLPQPAYTPDAVAAGVEGRVRVAISVDERGEVVDVRLLAGLGHGLDEAALAAARRATFEPALRCGKAVPATFTVAMRFSRS